MDYSITSYGGGEILNNILNGVAIMLHNEGGFFTSFLILTLGIGGFVVVMAAMVQEKGLSFLKTWALPAYLILSALILPKTTVNIHDPVDPNFHYSRVDNVPIGLALIASFPNKIGTGLAELIENIFLRADAPNVHRYTKTGPMFAAQVIAASQNITVTDPILKQNLKNFADNCYWWPYVILNIAPGATKAKETSNILEFVSQEAHPSLGIMWIDNQTGTSQFKVCEKCVPEIKKALGASKPSAFAQLGRMLGMSTQDGQETNRLLIAYTQDAWQSMMQDSSQLNDIVGQQMALNAVREASDDKREELGLSRLNTRLASYAATRAWESEKQSWLTKGQLAARHLPMIQTVFMGLLIIMFILIAPLTFIPGGFKTFGLWAKMMVWVNSWPIFYAVLNVIGVNFLCKNKIAGLNYLTQFAVADQAFDAYVLIQGLSWGVPFISWAFISGSGYALTQIISGITGSIGSGVGQSMVDNNHSIAVQNFRNRQEMNESIGQQKVGSSYDAAQTFNDGAMMSTTAMDGTQTFTLNKSQFRDDVSLQASNSDSMKIAKASEYSLGESAQARMTEAANSTIGKSGEVVEAFSKNQISTKGFNETENRDTANSFDRLKSAAQNYAKDHTMSDSSSLQGSLGGNVSAGASLSAPIGKNTEGIGKFLGSIGFSIDAGGRYSYDMNDRNALSKAESYGLSENDLLKISSGLNNSVSNNVNINSDSAQRSVDSLRESSDQTRSYGQEANAHFQKAKKWSELSDHMESISGSINSNITDDVLQHSANKRFGGDTNRAAEWARTDRSGFQEDARSYLKGYVNHNRGWMASVETKDINPQSLEKGYNDFQQKLAKEYKPLQSQDLSNKRNELNVDRKSMDAHHTSINLQKERIQTEISKPHPKSNMVRDNSTKIPGQYESESAKNKFTRKLK